MYLRIFQRCAKYHHDPDIHLQKYHLTCIKKFVKTDGDGIVANLIKLSIISRDEINSRYRERFDRFRLKIAEESIRKLLAPFTRHRMEKNFNGERSF